MSRVKTEELHQRLTEKKKNYAVQVQVHIEGQRIYNSIHGHVKNCFFDDCIKREWSESKMGGHIIETYYAIMNAEPTLIDKEPNAIIKYLVDKIKL